jgi:hypothetical protein
MARGFCTFSSNMEYIIDIESIADFFFSSKVEHLIELHKNGLESNICILYINQLNITCHTAPGCWLIKNIMLINSHHFTFK